MVIAPLSADTRPDLAYVLNNLREWDRREIAAVSWSDNPQDWIDAHQSDDAPFSFMAYSDTGRPVAAIGAAEMFPGLWSPWAFGTDEFGSIGLGLTRFVRNQFIPALEELGFRRAEVLSMEGHDQSHRWLTACGGVQEGIFRRYGKNGENFVQFVWYGADTSGHAG